MKKMITLLATLILVCFSQMGYSAGGPMNEDLTPLIPMAQKAVDAGKQGDVDNFIKEATETYNATETHPMSASQQRVLTRMRKSLKRANSGKLDEAVKLVEDAMTHMGKSDGPSFGGGS
ncbi:small metal-binding protein SmbP [Methylotuvimicrobium sp. KM1]|uniref:small metal-binding protein SmbP n=1 Tax=Methylotuvimicrobium sp. KM1 TaxID=3377707 RepID=UPI00384F5375